MSAGFCSTGKAKHCCARTKSQIKNLSLCLRNWRAPIEPCPMSHGESVPERVITLLPTVRSILKHENYLHVHKTRIFTSGTLWGRGLFGKTCWTKRYIFTVNIAWSGHIYIFRWQNVLCCLGKCLLRADFVHGGAHAICPMRGNKSEYLKYFQKYIWHGFGVKTSFMVGKYYICWKCISWGYQRKTYRVRIIVHIGVGGKIHFEMLWHVMLQRDGMHLFFISLLNLIKKLVCNVLKTVYLANLIDINEQTLQNQIDISITIH